MGHDISDPNPGQAVAALKDSYESYMAALKKVVDQADGTIPVLIDELSNKKASPIAKALGLMMGHPEAKLAIPRLLDWVIVQSPVHPDAREALIRAGDGIAPALLDRIRERADEGDDEAIRHLLDLGVQLSDDAKEQVVPAILGLLGHPNPHVREAAIAAIWRLGLPHGMPAMNKLLKLLKNDPVESVRTSAWEAIQRLDPLPQFHLAWFGEWADKPKV